MCGLNIKTHMRLLKESKQYLKDVKPDNETTLGQKKGAIVLTQEHMIEWLQLFEEDRIRLDGCNFAVVKR